jgi:hypothetical protein
MQLRFTAPLHAVDPSDNPANTEVNHLQLIPSGGPLTLAQSNATFDPDPSCK